MSDLWSEATRDYEAERSLSLVAEATAATEFLFPVVARSQSEADFANRVALVMPQVDQAVETASPEGGADEAKQAVLATWKRRLEPAWESIRQEAARTQRPGQPARGVDRPKGMSVDDFFNNYACSRCAGKGWIDLGVGFDHTPVDNTCPECKGGGKREAARSRLPFGREAAAGQWQPMGDEGAGGGSWVREYEPGEDVFDVAFWEAWVHDQGGPVDVVGSDDPMYFHWELLDNTGYGSSRVAADGYVQTAEEGKAAADAAYVAQGNNLQQSMFAARTARKIDVKCVRCGNKQNINIPSDPSTEVPCEKCGGRLAVYSETKESSLQAEAYSSSYYSELVNVYHALTGSYLEADFLSNPSGIVAMLEERGFSAGQAAFEAAKNKYPGRFSHMDFMMAQDSVMRESARHAEKKTYKPFCSLDCNREYHSMVASPDTANNTNPSCLNCGKPTKEATRHVAEAVPYPTSHGVGDFAYNRPGVTMDVTQNANSVSTGTDPGGNTGTQQVDRDQDGQNTSTVDDSGTAPSVPASEKSAQYRRTASGPQPLFGGSHAESWECLNKNHGDCPGEIKPVQTGGKSEPCNCSCHQGGTKAARQPRFPVETKLVQSQEDYYGRWVNGGPGVGDQWQTLNEYIYEEGGQFRVEFTGPNAPASATFPSRDAAWGHAVQQVQAWCSQGVTCEPNCGCHASRHTAYQDRMVQGDEGKWGWEEATDDERLRTSASSGDGWSDAKSLPGGRSEWTFSANDGLSATIEEGVGSHRWKIERNGEVVSTSPKAVYSLYEAKNDAEDALKAAGWGGTRTATEKKRRSPAKSNFPDNYGDGGGSESSDSGSTTTATAGKKMVGDRWQITAHGDDSYLWTVYQSTADLSPIASGITHRVSEAHRAIGDALRVMTSRHQAGPSVSEQGVKHWVMNEEKRRKKGQPKSKPKKRKKRKPKPDSGTAGDGPRKWTPAGMDLAAQRHTANEFMGYDSGNPYQMGGGMGQPTTTPPRGGPSGSSIPEEPGTGGSMTDPTAPAESGGAAMPTDPSPPQEPGMMTAGRRPRAKVIR